jgi:uncharacterized protein YfbU (UPF0304 family)
MNFYVNNDFSFITREPTEEGDFQVTNELAKGVLKDIAEVNAVPLKARDTNAQIFEKIVLKFNSLRDTKMTEETNQEHIEEIARQIVTDGYEADMGEEDMIIELFQTEELGLKKLTAASRLFNSIAATLGLKISTKERKEKAFQLLAEWGFAPDTYDDVRDAAERLESEIPNTTVQQAMSAIRAYAKENELELPKKKKGGGSGASSKVSKSISWLEEQLAAGAEPTETDYMDFVGTLVEKDSQAAKYKQFYHIFLRGRNSVN